MRQRRLAPAQKRVRDDEISAMVNDKSEHASKSLGGKIKRLKRSFALPTNLLDQAQRKSSFKVLGVCIDDRSCCVIECKRALFEELCPDVTGRLCKEVLHSHDTDYYLI